ncbi:MAG: hypothetical protein FWG79_00375 [Bacteroidales bacterium]|nr:hypothetical protein [Bacteroidales bacterium]
MKKFALSFLILSLVSIWFVGCSNFDKSQAVLSSESVAIFPDYTDITVPPNMAPLNFFVDMDGKRFVVDFIGENGYTFSISTKQDVMIPIEKWQTLLSENIGKSYQVQIYRKLGGTWEKLPVITNQISKDSVDPWLTYRLVPPEYDIWHDLHIQQRHLESFEVSDLTNNLFNRESCLNCHTPNQGNPDEFLVHFRAGFSGTIIYKDGELRRYNTRTVELEHHGVYPSWHPSGRFIAFAIVKPALYFHSDVSLRSDVFDDGDNANLGLLDLETNRMLTSPKLNTPGKIQETYPCWSPDGKWLYFCRSHEPETWDTLFVADSYLKLQFDLLRIPFDENTIAFGDIETLIDAQKIGKSVSVPKISPDGRWLLFVLTHQGSNPTWRSDADLYLMDLQTLEWKPLTEANSNKADTYVSWSQNSKWFVFSSKRNDGFVALSHFSHIDENGQASKPFVLPQKDPKFYKSWLKSFNVPELATGKVKPSLAEIEEAVQGPIIDVEFGWTNDANFPKNRK